MSHYTPGPGDILGVYAGHPHDPRTPDIDDEDATADVIEDVHQLLRMAEQEVSRGRMDVARQCLVEAKAALEELVGEEQ